ncbi:Transposase IS116/IS110/IS902 family [Anaerotruncus colihominis]|uniref:Transposase IS116/IS110/IS902 family n=1 Tax=Anaerotruncus colihominis TaxID=169435 RepID=A0A174S879_9FIRM|nr:Transposase IS116/IS110/IS902 family [Anaerotruncus colihominis]
MAAMIFAEVGAFSHFNSPDKQLACAGMSPSAYSSGQLKNCCTYMEKLGPRHLRCALYNTTKYVWRRVSVFAAYLAKNRTEGKHYHVAVSHTAKKLVRLIFAMEKFGMLYSSLACLLSDCRPGLRLPPATGVPVSPQYSNLQNPQNRFEPTACKQERCTKRLNSFTNLTKDIKWDIVKYSNKMLVETG